MDEAQEKLKSARLMECFLSTIEYADDACLIDEWKHPEILLQDKYGDCEDFALFVYDTLQTNGYKVNLHMVKNDEGLHAVCSYEKGKERGYFSNQYRVTTNGKLKTTLKDNGWGYVKPINRKKVQYGKIY